MGRKTWKTSPHTQHEGVGVAPACRLHPRVLSALARWFCSCKRLGSILPVFRSSARIHTRNGNSGNQSLTAISFTEQMTDSNTLCHSRARTRKFNDPRFTIKYIIHTRSSLHPRFPSSASILSTMPGQPSPNLSLSSLPIPSYRTIRLLPLFTIRFPI